MKKMFIFLLLFFVSACVKVGEFTPERHAQYNQGKPDCTKTPEKCIDGIPW